MLYFKALQEGLEPAAAGRPGHAAGDRHMAQESGWPALHAELERIDPGDRGAAAAHRRAAHPARAGGVLPHRPADVGADRARPRSAAALPHDPDRAGAERSQRPAPAHRAALRGHAGAGADRRSAAAARALRARTRRCRPCARSATGRSGNTWTASSAWRRCARRASPPRANWPSASSPGCGHGKVRRASTAWPTIWPSRSPTFVILGARNGLSLRPRPSY